MSLESTKGALASSPDPSDLERDGYLIVAVTEAVTELFAEVLCVGASFFRQAESIKARDAIREFHIGWQPLGGEFSIVPQRPDLHESFWITRGRKKEVCSTYSKIGLELWTLMSQYMEAMADIERKVTTALLRHYGIGIEHGRLEFDRDADLQLLYYQPSLHRRKFLQDPHDDGLYLTITKADQPGLELLLGRQYRAIGLAPNELFVLPGELMALLTGFHIRPLVHRVVRHPDQKERFTLGYFAPPNLERGGTITPWVVNDHNQHVDIMMRAIGNQTKFISPLQLSDIA